jgi:hypothetical protein
MNCRRTLAILSAVMIVLSMAELCSCSAAEVGSSRQPAGTTAPSMSKNSSPSGTGAGNAGGTGVAVPNSQTIPPGRSFVEGGGGPRSYTFREEWRKALLVAQQWRRGAFLVTASGQYVNSDGVPSVWQVKFVDAIPADKILMIEIDPWGNVTSKREVDTSKVTDLLQPGDARIPFGVMDSDAAVTICRKALEAVNKAAATGNASMRLECRADKTGPWWICAIEVPGDKYVTARVHALTGQVVVER